MSSSIYPFKKASKCISVNILIFLFIYFYMEIIESINNFSDFKNDKIIEFIKLGNDLISIKSEIDSELYLNSFLSYSRNYMNFLMNHTNYLNILYVYKYLLQNIKEKVDFIRYIIKINNFVLSIIKNIDFTDKITTIKDFPEYYIYFLASTDLLNKNINHNKLQTQIPLHELIINLTIIQSKEQIDKYNEQEYYDNLRFYFFNVNEIQIYTKNDLLRKAITQIQSIEPKQTVEYVKLLQLFTQSIYNLLILKHFEEINEIITILNPLIDVQVTSYNDIDNFIKSVIQPINNSQISVNNKSIINTKPIINNSDNVMSYVMASSVIGFILLDMRYNIM